MRMYIITFSEREWRKGKLFLHLKNETILPNYFYWKPHRACSQDGTVQGGDIVRAVWRRGIVKVPNGKEEEGERKCNKFIFGKNPRYTPDIVGKGVVRIDADGILNCFIGQNTSFPASKHF